MTSASLSRGNQGLRVTTTTGTYSHSAGITEQNVLEFTALDDHILLSLDVEALSQGVLIKVREKVDGSTYRTMDAAMYETDFITAASVKAGVVIELDGKGRDMKVTMQSILTEGSSKNVPYAYRRIIRH